MLRCASREKRTTRTDTVAEAVEDLSEGAETSVVAADAAAAAVARSERILRALEKSLKPLPYADPKAHIRWSACCRDLNEHPHQASLYTPSIPLLSRYRINLLIEISSACIITSIYACSGTCDSVVEECL